MVVEEWAVRAKHHKGLPVLITHGVNDSVLPFVASGWYVAFWKGERGFHSLYFHRIAEQMPWEM